ncbi:helix-turn-helix domain-containing protein [Bacteroides sp.]|uniref:helix-turn-helix domain-containing protein n=1 Tax=Bacteroides sp. TaxID=29523 RepID=UPI0025C2BD6F|nr:helix-turn-helix domain-containing protein [Bacteroides sp.]
MKYQYIVNMKTLGEQIKVRRTVLKIRQQELADLAGVSINTVVAIERGTGNPRIETFVSVCDVLGLQIVTKLKD